MLIRKLEPKDAAEVAEIHIKEIPTGFISSLGQNFVKNLYGGISKSRFGFGYVCKENSKIAGFICGATDVKRFYRELILKRGLFFTYALLKYVLDREKLINIFQTLFYPARLKEGEAKSEILSVAVREGYRRKNCGKRLMQAMVQEFKKRGISQVRVCVYDQNEIANKYYQSCGFLWVGKTKQHGNHLNVYVLRLDE